MVFNRIFAKKMGNTPKVAVACTAPWPTTTSRTDSHHTHHSY